MDTWNEADEPWKYYTKWDKFVRQFTAPHQDMAREGTSSSVQAWRSETPECWRQGERCLSPNLRQREQRNLPPVSSCVQALRGLDDAHHNWEGLAPATHPHANLTLETHPLIICNQVPGYSVSSNLTEKMNHHTLPLTLKSKVMDLSARSSFAILSCSQVTSWRDFIQLEENLHHSLDNKGGCHPRWL